MNDNVMDVLMYVFEHFYEDEHIVESQQHEMIEMLENAGFQERDIERALQWLDGLVRLCDQADDGSLARDPRGRILSPEDQALLPIECQNYLLRLEHLGIIDDFSREMILDRVSALETAVDVPVLRWVVQMVLYNLPGREQNYNHMEHLETAPRLH
jgi:Smg protein